MNSKAVIVESPKENSRPKALRKRGLCTEAKAIIAEAQEQNSRHAETNSKMSHMIS